MGQFWPSPGPVLATLNSNLPRRAEENGPAHLATHDIQSSPAKDKALPHGSCRHQDRQFARILLRRRLASVGAPPWPWPGPRWNTVKVAVWARGCIIIPPRATVAQSFIRRPSQTGYQRDRRRQPIRRDTGEVETKSRFPRDQTKPSALWFFPRNLQPRSQDPGQARSSLIR